jgi:hypothetical protein
MMTSSYRARLCLPCRGVMPPKKVVGDISAHERDYLTSAINRNWDVRGSDLVSDSMFPGRTAASLGAHLKNLRKEMAKKKNKGNFFSFLLIYSRFLNRFFRCDKSGVTTRPKGDFSHGH